MSFFVENSTNFSGQSETIRALTAPRQENWLIFPLDQDEQQQLKTTNSSPILHFPDVDSRGGGGGFGGSGGFVEEDFDYIFDNPSVRIAFFVLYTIVFCLCFFGNLAVVLVVTLHKRMRSITKFCLGNLAFANLCVGIFCIYQNLSTFLIDTWVFGQFLCKMYHFINSLSHTASILILVVMCVERYLAILHPFKCRQILTMRKLRVVIVTVWTISAILSSPRLYIYNTMTMQLNDGGPDGDISYQTFCAPKQSLYDVQTIDMCYFILLFVLPLIVISILYTRVGVYLWRGSIVHKQITNFPKSSASDRGDTSNNSFSSDSASSLGGKRNRNSYRSTKRDKSKFSSRRRRAIRYSYPAVKSPTMEEFSEAVTRRRRSFINHSPSPTSDVCRDNIYKPIPFDSEALSSPALEINFDSIRFLNETNAGRSLNRFSSNFQSDSSDSKFTDNFCDVGGEFNGTIRDLNFDADAKSHGFSNNNNSKSRISNFGKQKLEISDFYEFKTLNFEEANLNARNLNALDTNTSNFSDAKLTVSNFASGMYKVSDSNLKVDHASSPNSDVARMSPLILNIENSNIGAMTVPRINYTSPKGASPRSPNGRCILSQSTKLLHKRLARSRTLPSSKILSASTTPTAAAAAAAMAGEGNMRDKLLKPRQAVVRMLIVIVVTFAVCNLPFHVRKLCQNYLPNYDLGSNFSSLATPLTFLLMYVNCAINPIIYAFMSKSFRASLLDLVKCRLLRRNRNVWRQESNTGAYN